MRPDMKLIKAYLADERAATAVEYGLIAALIGVSIIVGADALGASINTFFADTADSINNTNLAQGSGP